VATENPLVFWEQRTPTNAKRLDLSRDGDCTPPQLNPEQRQALVQEWIQQEIGEKHPYQFAIHNPRSSGGLDQPHVHLMICERTLDGIGRDPEQFFRRYNPKNPEKGGAKKAIQVKTEQHVSKNLKSFENAGNSRVTGLLRGQG